MRFTGTKNKKRQKKKTEAISAQLSSWGYFKRSIFISLARLFSIYKTNRRKDM